jgi:uncharacterized membrane protein
MFFRTAILIPFLLMLLAVAFMPFLNESWWRAHFKKVSFFLAGIVICYYLFV